LPPVIPGMNTLWFWFKPESERRRLHGTPADVMRKFDVLRKLECCSNGLEIFLTPSKLSSTTAFTSDFYKDFLKLQHRSIHIGESDHDFLDKDSTYGNLIELKTIMKRLESNTIILHAHHLKKDRKTRNDMLKTALGSVDILVENNGFDDPWGASINALEKIFADCPEFGFCLDIAHVKDFSNSSLDDYIGNDQLVRRIREIHFSYSTLRLKNDPYEEKGYIGYSPYHALFTVVDIKPSKRTVEFITKYPVVIEGIVPIEDRERRYLDREVSLLKE
jgi:hypothetical protein